MTATNLPPAPSASPQNSRQKLRLIALVVLKRLRFFAVLIAVGLFIKYWEPIKVRWDRWTHSGAAVAKKLPPDKEFFCSMDPQVTRDEYAPNGDVPLCPVCGMPLTIHDKGKHEELPSGVTARVSFSPDRIAAAGIRTATLGYRPMARQIKTVGYVTFDETGLSRVVSRVDGYVEKLYADKSYTVVHKGDPLAEIYGPEFYSTSRELMLAARGQGVGELAASDRQRLIFLGVSEEDIGRMVASGKVWPTLVIRAPRSGHIIDKKIVLGDSVQAKMTLFEIADLSTVWIEADVYECDAPLLRAGQEIEATVESYPGRVFKGKIDLVHPHVEPETRTDRVRIALDNPHHVLRPGMYASVAISVPLETIDAYKAAARIAPRSSGAGQGVRAEFLAMPESAVIDTGEKKIVYVESAPGQFDGREVELGPRQDDFYAVLKGVRAGEKVAAAGSFLVDAETRLNPAAASTYYGASGEEQATAAATSAVSRGDMNSEMSDADELTDDELEKIDQLPEADREAAKAQRVCPVTGNHLGKMGVPVKIMLRDSQGGDRPVFLCCKRCVGRAEKDPESTLKKLEKKR